MGKSLTNLKISKQEADAPCECCGKRPLRLAAEMGRCYGLIALLSAGATSTLTDPKTGLPAVAYAQNSYCLKQLSTHAKSVNRIFTTEL